MSVSYTHLDVYKRQWLNILEKVNNNEPVIGQNTQAADPDSSIEWMKTVETRWILHLLNQTFLAPESGDPNGYGLSELVHNHFPNVYALIYWTLWIPLLF